MIDEAAPGHPIRRARDRYLAALHHQQQVLNQLPGTSLTTLARVLSETAEALRALAAEVPGRDRPAELDPRTWAALQQFRAGVADLHTAVPASRLPVEGQTPTRI